MLAGKGSISCLRQLLSVGTLRAQYRNDVYSVLGRQSAFRTQKQNRFKSSFQSAPSYNWLTKAEYHSPQGVNKHSFTQIQDLKRFLEEVGTDAKQARFWLKEFQRVSHPLRPFAVIQLEADIFQRPDMLESLGSCLSFLQRNSMKCVVVHGSNLENYDGNISADTLQAIRSQENEHSMLLVSVLESHGTLARPLFSGTQVLMAEQENGSCYQGTIKTVHTSSIEWCLHSGHIPVINSIGETQTGQLLSLNVEQVAEKVMKTLQPLKCMMVNTAGGILDTEGKVIANINLPTDLESCEMRQWCTPEVKEKVSKICALLQHLPKQSSVVITSANTMLAELFTHQGYGTLLKMTEPIHIYYDFSNVDVDRLCSLINRAFGRNLTEGYLAEIQEKLVALYLSEGYNAAAIVTKEPGIDIPYLCKFAVCQQSQGQGTSEMLWNSMRENCPKLFWRSKKNNKITPWYFRHCEGSCTNGEWIVFWYGVTNHSLTSQLIDFALQKEPSFYTSMTGPDNTLVE